MPRPGPFTLGKDLVPVVLGGPQGRSGRMRKFSPTPGFDPQAVKPVASRSFDWATPAHAVCPYDS